ncbi:MAG: sigma-70 family RNA polymerase sigma factor [Phycisphaerales bacterium]|nr:sigma-70 family RNA polymerase sigma factor [Phycisphaerales bacterium]
MSASEADLYLVDAVRRGEPDAWREVIARYEGRLLSFARRMLAQKTEAEDIVQETFLGLLRSLENYDRSRSLETYLFAIVRNKLSDHFRKQKGQRQSLESLTLEEGHGAYTDRETPSGRLDRQETLDAQRAALTDALRVYVGQCQEQNRFDELIIVEMLVVQGLRNKEVAADLNITETAVAGVKFRVLDRWRKLLAERGQAVDWSEAELAHDSTVGRVWREEGVSCAKRSTLGRYLLGALDPAWESYLDYHIRVADCDRCAANLEDLSREEERDAEAARERRERWFASSVGFLSRAE